MTGGTASRRRVILARLVIALAVGLCVVGLIIHGFSGEVRNRIIHDIAARPGGPMTFRFVLQPIMAAAAALQDGIKDARLRREAYLWAVFTKADGRGARLSEGIISTARIILLGLLMDAIYQFFVLKTFYPGEMAIIAILLAFLPYLLLRGPFARLAGWWIARKAAGRAP